MLDGVVRPDDINHRRMSLGVGGTCQCSEGVVTGGSCIDVVVALVVMLLVLWLLLPGHSR